MIYARAREENHPHSGLNPSPSPPSFAYLAHNSRNFARLLYDARNAREAHLHLENCMRIEKQFGVLARSVTKLRDIVKRHIMLLNNFAFI